MGAAAVYLLLTRQLFSARTWKRLHPFSGSVGCATDRSALAHPGDVAQSSVFRLHASQRTGAISRVPVVLLYQRAASAFPEPALSSRLQHGSSLVLLAFSSDLAVPLERLLPRRCEALLQARRSRGANALVGAVLGRFHSCVFYLLDDARILFHALLSGSRAPSRLGPGNRRNMGYSRNARALRRLRVCSYRRSRNSHPRARHPRARRHLIGPQPSSQGVYAFAGTYGRSDARFVRLPSFAARPCGNRISCGSARSLSAQRAIALSGPRPS